ncbi:MAG: hypothetical protein A3E84_03235 [Gammaproteobacteria bacterium RIFCSPHIGHO2_12_FULL_42_13]|nr:MAG: hypothetical protein A3E84_03235 [Gammaproteobacteria bacterium RIFCSPHIGHO2_12_FULL_42_13]
MSQLEKDVSAPEAWKGYLLVAVKFLIAFYISTLCVAIFFIHRGQHWLVPAIILGMLYLFVIVISFRQVIRQLPMAAIMLAAPTIPLCMLLIFLSLLPLL